MTLSKSDLTDIEFVLYEQLGVDRLCKTEKYGSCNRKMFDMVLKEARNFAIKEILPTFEESDRQGVIFDQGEVRVPDCFERIHALFCEGEWGALTEDIEYGGQALPHSIAHAALGFMMGANYTYMTYAILGHGAGKMIDLFGTDEQKKTYLKNLYIGKWGGSMLLTEPQAGSDLGALTTSAKQNPDGTWSITGNKIFITNGEQNLTENIIHPVLARIEGAPSGTRGISIFIVPKFLLRDDGSLGDRNDVVCTGVEDKHGLHGSPTCSLALGSKGTCTGYLLGEENMGLQIMFHMMNEVRLEVGIQAYTHAICAYNIAADYAKQRSQGRALENLKDHTAPPVTIVNHPDVRRMLIWMKAHVTGMRSLIMYTAFCFDRIETTESTDEKNHFIGVVDVLTPIIKAYCSEKGYDVCVQAMQVLGGYGYTRDYPVEQHLRDCKITSIYEGSNGIQAMDLMGRKLSMNEGFNFKCLLKEIEKTIKKAHSCEGLEEISDSLKEVLNLLEKTVSKIGNKMVSPEFKTAFAQAHPLLMVFGDVTMAWMLLDRAAQATSGKSAKNKVFYQGQINTAKYFIKSILPVTTGQIHAIAAMDSSPIDIDERAL